MKEFCFMMHQKILISIAIISLLWSILIVLVVLENRKIRRLQAEQDKVFSCIRSKGPGPKAGDVFVAYNRNLAKYGIRVRDSFKGYFTNNKQEDIRHV